MYKLIIYLLILNLIIQIVVLFFVIRRGIRKSPISIGLVNSIGRKITKDSCEKLEGTVRDGRCIVRTVEENKECITDIGKIYEKNNCHISNSNESRRM